MLQKVRSEPARLGDRGQHQRVDPHRKPGQQPGQRAGRGAALPVQPAEQGGRELGHSGKADQPDADQRVSLAGQMEVRIAQQHQAQNGGATHAEQHTGQVMPGARTELARAQQQGHHKFIADHGGDRNGLHDHHAGGRRQAADKGKQGQRVLPRRQRQRQDKILGIHGCRTKVQQTAQRNRQHEQVDDQHVEREHPDRAPQVAFTHVLHHHDLKLARQEHDRQHRQQDLGKPLGPGKVGTLLQPQQVCQRRHRTRARKQVGQAVEQAIDHEHTDGQKRHQLDERLEGDGCHHALVPFGGVELARAKDHAEPGQDQGHIERAIAVPVPPRCHAGAARRRQQRVTGGDGLELQRDVGHDADHRDQRHETREQRALARAAGDEVGDRGDAVDAGDADHLADHDPAQDHGEGGTEIDRQKPDAAGCGAAHAAEVGPGRAVHRHRQGIDPGAVDHRAPLPRAPVADIGDREQQQQIGERSSDDGSG